MVENHSFRSVKNSKQRSDVIYGCSLVMHWHKFGYGNSSMVGHNQLNVWPKINKLIKNIIFCEKINFSSSKTAQI